MLQSPWIPCESFGERDRCHLRVRRRSGWCRQYRQGLLGTNRTQPRITRRGLAGYPSYNPPRADAYSAGRGASPSGPARKSRGRILVRGIFCTLSSFGSLSRNSFATIFRHISAFQSLDRRERMSQDADEMVCEENIDILSSLSDIFYTSKR